MGYALGFGEGEEVLPQELLEGGEDQDEMFSMMLGDDDYAMADYWQWRATSKRTDPAIWRIQDDGGDQLVRSFLLSGLFPFSSLTRPSRWSLSRQKTPFNLQFTSLIAFGKSSSWLARTPEIRNQSLDSPWTSPLWV